jgi:murein DD-endopeptidase MepM/ murein hydrolase activator NlpD
VLAALAGASLPHGAGADPPLSDKYRYKFPCAPAENCWVTTTAHGNNALDFDIGGSAYDGTIRAMSQGAVVALNEPYPYCTYNLQPPIHTLGRWAIVYDISGKDTVYGHMAGFAVGLGDDVLQGDRLGVEGDVGYSAYCEVHLHWEPGGSLPSYIDNHDTSSLCAICLYTDSTNTPGGEIWGYFIPFPSIRQLYVQKNGWLWGWTHDVGRPGLPFPQGLYVHNYRTWGWEQTFAQEAGWFGGIERGMYAPVWNQGAAKPIDGYYWPFWNNGVLVGSLWRNISLPIGERDACPPGSRVDCAGYQLFHLGYIWNNWSATVQPVWCPDVGGTAFQHTKNGVADIQDVLDVLWYAFCELGGGPNANGAYYDAWFDMDGSVVTDISDILGVLAGTIRDCYPT